jgi:hypothetical protein
VYSRNKTKLILTLSHFLSCSQKDHMVLVYNHFSGLMSPV